MPPKMRLGRLVVGLIAFAALGWIGWNALHVLPDAWSRYRRASTSDSAIHIDTTLFQGDSAVSSDTTSLTLDSSLTGLLSRLGPELGIARRTMGSVRTRSGSVPLYSLVLRRGSPLPILASQAIDSLAAHGFEIVESTENPRGTWPWVCHLARSGQLVAALRAKIDADPAPGSFGLNLVLWADSLDADLLAALPRLPRGAVLALPPRALAEQRLLAMASSAGLRLALLARVETTRFPVLRQEDTRLLLHHQEKDVARKLGYPPETSPKPDGLVVLDGDRGATDPGLSERVAAWCKGRSLWLLDATGTPTSRLEEAARKAHVEVLAPPVPTGGRSLDKALVEAGDRAEKAGFALLVWPLDSSSIVRIGTDLPLLVARGVGIRPPAPQDRHEETGE